MKSNARSHSFTIIERLKPSVMNFDLNRMVRVMSRLGHPENSFPAIHVAGTNGKGSVTAMIARSLQEAGLTVGMYTSPHLERLNERFQVNGRMITDGELDRLSRSLYRQFPHLTQFEFLTAVAFLWLAQKKVDVAVIETGLGGRLDATNVLHRVLVSVITNIDLDHTNWLGKTVPKIAFEKAGIIKPQVPLVTGATGEALKVIRSVAERKRAPVEQVSVPLAGQPLGLRGQHQKMNAAIAAAALRTVARQGTFRILERHIRTGLRRVRWPGRFEEIQPGIILDGAHNAAGCRTLAQTIKERKLSPVNLMFGALGDKDLRQMARALSGVTAHCVTVPVPSDRSASAEELANLPAWRRKAQPARSIEAGWRQLNRLRPLRPLVVAGSLYLVGDMRRKLR